MNEKPPLFSVIIPVYNEEKYIREALDSILAQTDPDWEALVINDGSTDSTPEIVAEYASKDARIRVFNKPNGGQSSAINLGVKQARGAWLCWLSGDDYFDSCKLGLHRQWIEKYPAVEFFFTGFWLILPNGKRIEYSLDWLELERPAYHLLQLLHSNWIMGISVCVQRDAWIRTGEFNAVYRYAHDLDMWVRLMLGTRHQYIPERTCTMRYHPEQETARFALETLFDAAAILINLLNHCSFQELISQADLRNTEAALDALNRTLDVVAGASEAYLYKLGVHSLLHLRILEWFADLSPGQTKDAVCLLMRSRAAEFARYYEGLPFGLIWQATYAALDSKTAAFTYFPCAADQIGKTNYYLQRLTDTNVARRLRSYLEQTAGAAFEDEPIVPLTNYRQMVLLLDPGLSLDDQSGRENQKLKAMCCALAKAGFFVLLIGRSNYRMGLFADTLYLGANGIAEQNSLLKSLGRLEAVVVVSNPEMLKMITAPRKLYFDLLIHDSPAFETVNVLVKEIQSVSPKATFRFFGAKHFDSLIPAYKYLVPHSIRIHLRLGQQLRRIFTFLNARK